VKIIIVGHPLFALIIDFEAGVLLQPIPLTNLFKPEVVAKKLFTRIVVGQSIGGFTVGSRVHLRIEIDWKKSAHLSIVKHANKDSKTKFRGCLYEVLRAV
jgi:hypothetical protein